jgi:hypothetical protein
MLFLDHRSHVMPNLSLHQHTAAAQAADQRRIAAEHRHARRSFGSVAMRRAAGADDERAVGRLAQLDEMTPPRGDVLLAEVDGRLVAALPLEGGPAIADPFTPTQEIVELLVLRAAALDGDTHQRLRARRLRRAASGLRHAA